MKDLSPKDHAEAVALFRSEIVGALTRREFDRGELADALLELSKQRFRPPGAKFSKTYSLATLERWHYAYKAGGLDALKPAPRCDRGRCQELTDEQRQLLLAIREEHPAASVPVILRTLVAEGRLEPEAISASSVRRFYQEKGLDRVAVRNQARGKVRLRWQAERPGALWHTDVCHGTAVVIDGRSQPVRIHGILDDASRYVIALEAFHHERESEMLALLVRAVRKHGPADALYLDNGATYRGQALSLACARMGTTLIHAKPYDAPARGKMERFWRTLREGCLDHTGSLGSLHDINVRLWAFIDQHYHRAPHGGLLGKSPQSVYEATPRPVDAFDEQKLRKALTIHARRRVRRDSTLPMDGADWETDLHFLAGKLVTVSRCLVDPTESPRGRVVREGLLAGLQAGFARSLSVDHQRQHEPAVLLIAAGVMTVPPHDGDQAAISAPANALSLRSAPNLCPPRAASWSMTCSATARRVSPMACALPLNSAPRRADSTQRVSVTQRSRAEPPTTLDGHVRARTRALGAPCAYSASANPIGPAPYQRPRSSP